MSRKNGTPQLSIVVALLRSHPTMVVSGMPVSFTLYVYYTTSTTLDHENCDVGNLYTALAYSTRVEHSISLPTTESGC